MHTFLETRRLMIKVPENDDLADQYILQSDPDVMRYVGKGPRTINEVEATLNQAIDHYQKHQFSLGSVYEKATGLFIGRAGLIYLGYDDSQDDIEVAYALIKAAWGQGYGQELATALISWGFSHLAITKLVAITKLENIASRIVLEKVGMYSNKTILEQGLEVAYYEIYKNDHHATY